MLLVWLGRFGWPAPIVFGVAACVSNPVSQVQALGDGAYSISFAAKSDNEAIRKAGEFCHAKGQKLSVLHEGDAHEVRFRCVPAE